jgi:hypothetical protein
MVLTVFMNITASGTASKACVSDALSTGTLHTVVRGVRCIKGYLPVFMTSTACGRASQAPVRNAHHCVACSLLALCVQ